ncbi:MAG: CheR family methyltransferase [Deltaproteobacteria bacterium]|nr:CheR family methyltransferase [Deltaproteobacteria bacterium]
MNDAQFRQLLNRFEFSWSGYRKVKKGVKKRIGRYMTASGYRTMAAFLAELEQNDETRHACELLMTVSISRFFRDRRFWETLEKTLLPKIIQRRDKKISVWSAGCACGDEVYSFMIVWDRLSKTCSNLPGLEMTATDLNPTYLQRARAGIYSHGSLKELTPEIRSQYFRQKPGKKLFQVKKFLKKNISWRIHHLLSDPPGRDFDIVFLRNSVLTYYEEKLKKKALEKVLSRLVPGGILIIGSHESIPFERPDLSGVEPYPYVFSRTAEKQPAVFRSCSQR